MRIERIDAAYDGDNISKAIKAIVDEKFRTLDIYIYFVPAVGIQVYATAEPLTLDQNGEAEYLIPGDVLNGEGYFGAQLVGIDPNGTEIAKSEIYTDECGASIDDNSAVLPTGEVITLAQLKARLDALTASDVAYDDTENIGATNVQDALDYALTHGGGGGTDMPYYDLTWDPNPSQLLIDANLAVINTFRERQVGTYAVRLNSQGGGSTLAAPITKNGNKITLYFVDYSNEDYSTVRVISSASTIGYSQNTYSTVDLDFDPTSDKAGSMYGIAEYIGTRIGTTGNLDPSSYASASDVTAIESKIPAAASSSNKLADKNFVNSSIATNTAYFIGTFDSVAELEAYSGTLTNNDYAFVVTYDHQQVSSYDRYKYNASTSEWLYEYTLNNTGFTSDQWAAINSAITAAKVTAYDAHVADTTIHVTANDKTAWNGAVDAIDKGTVYAVDNGEGLSISDRGIGGATHKITLIEIPESKLSMTFRNKVDHKLDKPDEVGTGTNITLADNTEYRLSDVTTLTLTYPSGNFECWLHLKFAASGTITVTLPTSSYIGSAPVFANGETWEMSIKDGVVVAGKVEASS